MTMHSMHPPPTSHTAAFRPVYIQNTSFLSGIKDLRIVNDKLNSDILGVLLNLERIRTMNTRLNQMFSKYTSRSSA